MTVNFVYISFIAIVIVLLAVGIYFSLSLAYKKASQKGLEERTEKVYTSLEKYLRGDGAGSSEAKNFLRSNFSKSRDIRAFYYGYDRYVGEYGYSKELKLLLSEIVDCKKLMKTNLVRKSYEKSYVLYLMSEFRLDGDKQIEMALDALDDDSVYVRNNALRVISGKDSIDSMLEAIERMKGNSKYFNDRVTIDFLDSFAGDKEDLESELLKRMDTYDYRHKGLFIEHLINRKNASQEVRDKLVDLLMTSNNIGLLIKISKYFGRVRDPRVEDRIRENLSHEDWRLRAVSARTIGSYPSEKSVMDLKRTVGDNNYYVRRNSALALSKIVTKEELFKEAYESQDNYASQALAYVIEKEDPEAFADYKKRMELDEGAGVLC